MGLYSKNIKYPDDTEDNKPLRLVYSSDSFRRDEPGLVFGVLLYEVNDDYTPKTSNTDLSEENNLQNPTSLSQQGDGNSTAAATAANSSTSKERSQ
jgi:dolichyl-diphosphooligosaccharide--protein glycosyltransferase